jgi:hypothetical protein
MLAYIPAPWILWVRMFPKKHHMAGFPVSLFAEFAIRISPRNEKKAPVFCADLQVRLPKNEILEKYPFIDCYPILKLYKIVPY